MPWAAGSQRQLKTVLCDLDDCLYRSPEMPELVRENIQSKRLHVTTLLDELS